MLEYEKATRARLPATGEYLLNHTIYLRWKQSQLDVHNNDKDNVLPAEPKILFVKGALPLMLENFADPLD
jgi:hypothetical protein